jgi:hypothetical protein
MATNNTSSTRGEPWIEIDIKGFAQILRNKGIARIALEPISNAFDTEATEITVLFNQHDRWASLTVTDDDPNGFADLRDAYMLFAPSQRREDPTKRGRFGQGEKELIAICADGGCVEVQSTTGTISFEENGRTSSKRKTEAGTKLIAHFKCNKAQAAEFESLVRSLIIPEGVKLVFNGDIIDRPTPVKVVRETLATKIVDDEGNLADTRRQTDVELYEPASGEAALIYELGVPVVEHDGRWHVNVMQKVPLNTARDNVTPSYLRRLREIMLNETHDLLTSVDMKSAWVTAALPKATEEALTNVVTQIHGKDAVIFDPSNREATLRATEQGRVVIMGRQFSANTWNRIREHEIFRPAGQVIQVGVRTSPDGIPPIDRKQWTDEMKQVERYVHKLGEHLLEFKPTVQFAPTNCSTGENRALASWGGGEVTFYLRHLGKRWPTTVTQEDLDALILHEFTHHWVDNHYSDRFIDRLADLGAKLRSCKAKLQRTATG